MGSYWPPLVASDAMLLASDALSSERTAGFYMLSACDLSLNQLVDFARFHGRSESLMTLAMTNDADSVQLLNQRTADTQRNVTRLRSFTDILNSWTKFDETF